MKINLGSNCSAESEYITDRSYQLREGQICIQLIKERFLYRLWEGYPCCCCTHTLSHFIEEDIIDNLVK